MCRPCRASTAPASQQPDPPKDPPATILPDNIDALLRVGRYLLGYGRHLLDTIRQRATAPNFAAIAANFGTASLPAITARLTQTQFCYAHEYQPGDLLIIDDRASLHKAGFDYDHSQHRRLYRMLVRGDRPY